MKDINYYFIIDNSFQWFSYIVALKQISENDWRTVELISFDSTISGDFLNNILNRETHFMNRRINNEYYFGWSLSQKEFLRLKRIIELYPMAQEYRQLLNS